MFVSENGQARPVSDPRERQRNRTRRALVEAAAELMRAGEIPTVARVAEAAEISRATAYRYFPTADRLLSEAVFQTAGGSGLFAQPPPLDPAGDPADWLATAARSTAGWVAENETALRAVQRAATDPKSGVRRPGYRLELIATALEPLRDRVDPATLDRLAATLTLMFGIDSFVILTEVAGVDRADVADIVEWAVRTLIRASQAG